MIFSLSLWRDVLLYHNTLLATAANWRPKKDHHHRNHTYPWSTAALSVIRWNLKREKQLGQIHTNPSIYYTKTTGKNPDSKTQNDRESQAGTGPGWASAMVVLWPNGCKSFHSWSLYGIPKHAKKIKKDQKNQLQTPKSICHSAPTGSSWKVLHRLRQSMALAQPIRRSNPSEP